MIYGGERAWQYHLARGFAHRLRLAKLAAIETSPVQLFTYVPFPETLSNHFKKIQQQIVSADKATDQDIDHCTLLYIPKAEHDVPDEEIRRILSALRTVCSDTPPIKVKVQGWGYLDGATKDKQKVTALVGLLDAPGLEDLHVKLKAATKAIGYNDAATHSFVPHVTFAYLNHGERVKNLPLLSGEFTIDKVMFANRDKTSIPLLGKPTENTMLKAALQKLVKQANANCSYGAGGGMGGVGASPTGGASGGSTAASSVSDGHPGEGVPGAVKSLVKRTAGPQHKKKHHGHQKHAVSEARIGEAIRSLAKGGLETGEKARRLGRFSASMRKQLPGLAGEGKGLVEHIGKRVGGLNEAADAASKMKAHGHGSGLVQGDLPGVSVEQEPLNDTMRKDTTHMHPHNRTGGHDAAKLKKESSALTPFARGFTSEYLKLANDPSKNLSFGQKAGIFFGKTPTFNTATEDLQKKQEQNASTPAAKPLLTPPAKASIVGGQGKGNRGLINAEGGYTGG